MYTLEEKGRRKRTIDCIRGFSISCFDCIKPPPPCLCHVNSCLLVMIPREREALNVGPCLLTWWWLSCVSNSESKGMTVCLCLCVCVSVCIASCGSSAPQHYRCSSPRHVKRIQRQRRPPETTLPKKRTRPKRQNRLNHIYHARCKCKML
jgi:hypothetical protein